MFGALWGACLAANDRLDLSCAVYTEQGGYTPDLEATARFLNSEQALDFRDGQRLKFTSREVANGYVLDLTRGPIPVPQWQLDLTGPFGYPPENAYANWKASINLEVAYGTYEPQHYIHLMRPFLQAVFALLKPTFAFSCHDWSVDKLHTLEDQLSERAGKKVEALPWWLYWETMVYGPPLVASFELETLLSTPAQRVDNLGGDVVWVEGPNGLGNDTPSLVLLEPENYDVNGLYYVGQGEMKDDSVTVVDQKLRLLRIPKTSIHSVNAEGEIYIDKPTVVDYLGYPHVHPGTQRKNVVEHLNLFSANMGHAITDSKFPFYELIMKHSSS